MKSSRGQNDESCGAVLGVGVTVSKDLDIVFAVVPNLPDPNMEEYGRMN